MTPKKNATPLDAPQTQHPVLIIGAAASETATRCGYSRPSRGPIASYIFRRRVSLIAAQRARRGNYIDDFRGASDGLTLIKARGGFFSFDDCPCVVLLFWSILLGDDWSGRYGVRGVGGFVG